MVTRKKVPASRKPAPPPPRKTGMAVARSLKIANDYAAGTRQPPPEEALELPINATPLDVLIMAMRRAYMIGGSLLAAEYAEKAAPYLHGKISSIELKNPGAPGSAQPVPFRIEFVEPNK